MTTSHSWKSGRCSVILLLISLYFSAGGLVASAQDCSSATTTNRNAILFVQANSENPQTGAEALQTGTGFIISASGYVLTAYHVVKANETVSSNGTKIVWTLTITGSVGSTEAPPLALNLIHAYPKEDVALLQFRGTNLALIPLRIGNPDTVLPGSELCSAGFPANDKYQYEFQASAGSLGGKGGPDGLWTTQMPSNTGESGAPVFTVDGRVVALKYGGDASLQNVNALTPINFANEALILANIPVWQASNPLPPTAIQIGPRTLFQSDLIKAIYEDAGPNIKLTLTSPIGVYPSALFDVNANGVVDANIDVAYALTQTWTPCTQYMISQDAFTQCGQRHSNATLTHSEANNQSQNIWLIPKTEVSNHSGNFAGLLLAPGNFTGLVLDIMDVRPNPPHRTVIPAQPFLTPFVLSWK